MNEYLLIIGFILIFIGIILISLYGISNINNQENNFQYSFILFIGPFPIGISNSKTLYIISLIIGLLLIIAIIIIFKIAF